MGQIAASSFGQKVAVAYILHTSQEYNEVCICAVGPCEPYIHGPLLLAITDSALAMKRRASFSAAAIFNAADLEPSNVLLFVDVYLVIISPENLL
jgi:hypothetical protein